jgi:dTDP-4-amino-4,6-dideoxygalactose transaminase
MKDKIYVTRPSLPELDEFIPYLEKIWESKQLTNNGSFHQQLEKELAEYLGVKYVSLFTNGTLALITALQALGIKGQVITTPYSFVATTHSLFWNGIEPVFVDIEDEFCNIDPNKIEAAITPQTTAIMPVHVYGNPCAMNEIQNIADKHGLKVIYDACHAFGVNLNGESVLNFGDLSVLSFHATKVFTTIEGGAIISHDAETKKRIDFLKNFGFANETTVVQEGINAKMNEIQAAFGLLHLKKMDQYLKKRKEIVEKYKKELENICGISWIEPDSNVTYNYSYFPIFIDAEEYGNSRDDLYAILKDNNIYGRRYFYPLISEFPTYKGMDSAKKENLPVAHKKADQVICLPLYPDLTNNEINEIVKVVKSNRKIK